MVGTEDSGEILIDEIAHGDEVFVSDSLDMILNNYRGIVEGKGEPFDIQHLTDVLKAFALYLYGEDLKRVSMIDSETADEKLFSAVSGKGVHLQSGFYSWKDVSTVVQGLRTMSVPVSASALLRAFKRFSNKLYSGTRMNFSLENIVVLRDDVNNLISEMVISDKVLFPWYLMTTIQRLGEGRRFMVSDNYDDDLKRLTVLMIGAQCIDRSKVLDPEPDGDGHGRDAVLFLPASGEFDEPAMLKWVMDSISKGSVLVLITPPYFCTSSNKEIVAAKEFLKGFRIECQYKMANGLPGFAVPMFVTKIVKAEPSGEVRLVDSIEGLEGSVEQSKFRWNLEEILHRGDFGHFETVMMSEVIEVRRGNIVPKEDMTPKYDSKRPVYIRPMDIEDGRIKKRSKLQTIAVDGYRQVVPGSILVESLREFGKSVMILGEDAPCVASSSFNVVSTKGSYSSEYLLAFFNSSFFIAQANNYCFGFVHNLTTKKMLEIELPVATLEQQNKIVREYRALDNPDPAMVWSIFSKVLNIQIP